MRRTAKEIQNESTVTALKKTRLHRKVSRKELASRLNVSVSAIEKYERGMDYLSTGRVNRILNALNSTEVELLKLKRGRSLSKYIKMKNVKKKEDRRSYQKIITKECKVLRSIRRSLGLSQDKVSKLCGYSRSTIGHIENGRIELTKNRLLKILNCYGLNVVKFHEIYNQDIIFDEIVDECIELLWNKSPRD